MTVVCECGKECDISVDGEQVVIQGTKQTCTRRDSGSIAQKQ
tara:strand:+ start:2241 stop:2366 length:126 start_codon:yes stop_codon:yes gene_type:complete